MTHTAGGGVQERLLCGADRGLFRSHHLPSVVFIGMYHNNRHNYTD
jgi:hypothetical protein